MKRIFHMVYRLNCTVMKRLLSMRRVSKEQEEPEESEEPEEDDRMPLLPPAPPVCELDFTETESFPLPFEDELPASYLLPVNPQFPLDCFKIRIVLLQQLPHGVIIIQRLLGGEKEFWRIT